MDLQKEREAFECHKFKDQYDELKAYYDEHEREHGYRYPSYTYDDEWEAWLAAKAQAEKALLEQFEINNKLVEQIEKLKAQAVPEGFVLMPMVPSERMIYAVRQCYEGEAYLPYSLYSEFVNQAIIERMEAQEQAND